MLKLSAGKKARECEIDGEGSKIAFPWPMQPSGLHKLVARKTVFGSLDKRFLSDIFAFTSVLQKPVFNLLICISKTTC